MSSVRVLVEEARTRTFASALDWPGWARSAKTPSDALVVLDEYRTRYCGVLAACAVATPTGAIEVVEHVEGNTTTEFGAPSILAALDGRPLRREDRTRLVEILEACWTGLDAAAAATRALRPGPRGGGRTLHGVHEHVTNAEDAGARKLGLRVSATNGDPEKVAALRERVVGVVLGTVAPDREGGWPVRYAVRRIAWHACDHLFEIEDRATS